MYVLLWLVYPPTQCTPEEHKEHGHLYGSGRSYDETEIVFY